MNNARILCEANITPVDAQNPEWVDDGSGKNPDVKGNPRYFRNPPAYAYLRARGAEPYFMVYEGTLNRSNWWSTSGVPHTDGLSYQDGANSNPPTENAVKACARLAGNASLYGVAADDYLPIVFDIENASVALDLNSTWQTQLQNVFNCAKWAREVNQYSSIMHYGIFPYAVGAQADSFWGSVEVKNILDALTHINPFLYFWDIPAFSLNQMFDETDVITRALDRYAPDVPRVMTVCPYYQIYWPQNARNPAAAAKKAGQPVPSAFWRKWLKYLVDRDYNIALWGVSLDSAGRAAITAALDLAYS